MHTEETMNVLATFLHTCYYYGISAHVGYGIVLLSRLNGIKPLELLIRYRKEELIRSTVDELLRNQA